jgi:DNA polymerase-3 subunit alpha
LAEGALKISQIIKRCQQYAMPAVGITDTNNLFGALEFSLACAENGIQPIIGTTLRVRRPHGHPIPSTASPSDDFLVLLAQSHSGYQNLMHMVSDSYICHNHEGLPYYPFEKLDGYTEGLIALTGGMDGAIGKLLADQRPDEAEAMAKQLKNLFPDRLYIEIGRHGLPKEYQNEPAIISLADHLGLPLVATNTVFFNDETMYEAHDALLCIAGGVYVNQPDRRHETTHHYFKSPQAMSDLFYDLPDAIQNTKIIAQRCHYMPQACKPILPAFPTESAHTEAEELRLQSQHGLAQRLAQQVFPSRAPEDHERLKTIYEERLAYELNIIETMGFPGYFLIVSDFIKWAKSQQIPVGPGRGSGAGSLVAWSLTITDVDPIRFNLLFERFLNPERVSMPDFDIDFCQDRRDEVIAYVCDKYGSNRVAHIITFGKLQARAVIRDVGRVLQMPYSQVDRITKLIPNIPANPVTLQQAIDQEPLLQQMIHQDPVVAKLIDIGLKLEGLYRHASTHAAGVVIGDRPLTELVPLYKDDRSALPATQFNMKYVELAGLLKFDFLGLKTLTVLQYTIDLLRQRGIAINLSTIPLDDPATFALLQRVETVAIFQLESTGMRDVVRKLAPDRFEEIIALVALYRPGPMDDIPRYVACKHGLEPVTYAHPALEPILKDSFGVMVYQEQVMQIAQVLSGYSLGAADLLRRAMGKKIKSEMDAQRQRFVVGAVANGVEEQTAHLIFDQIAKFAGYGFNKSHAAPYALLAYQTAYLKANYPVEFFAATMTYDMHNTDKLNVYQQELKRLAIALLPPDINASDARFKVETTPDGQLAVRYALAAIKNVGEAAMMALVEERQARGPFKDLNDFCQRLNHRIINKRQIENLIRAGALDCLEPNRRRLFENIEQLLKEASLSNTQQDSLFATVMPSMICLPEVGDWSPLERLHHEFDAVGFYLSAHPLTAYQQPLTHHQFDNWTQVLATPQQESAKLAGVILAKQERTSKQGSRFAFLQVSDESGIFEVVLFSELLSRLKTESPHLLEPGHIISVRVNLRREEESVRCTATEILSLETLLHHAQQHYILKLHPHIQKHQIESIKNVLSYRDPGNSSIQLSLSLSDEVRVDILLPSQYNIDQKTYFNLQGLPGIEEIQQK